MLCSKNHRFLPVLDTLEENQAGPGRHKCAGCAYELGYDHATKGYERHLDYNLLKDSQAGTGRHKDCQAAYNMGYFNGLQARQNN